MHRSGVALALLSVVLAAGCSSSSDTHGGGDETAGEGGETGACAASDLVCDEDCADWGTVQAQDEFEHADLRDVAVSDAGHEAVASVYGQEVRLHTRAPDGTTAYTQTIEAAESPEIAFVGEDLVVAYHQFGLGPIMVRRISPGGDIEWETTHSADTYGGFPHELLFRGGALWVLVSRSSLLRLDSATGEVTLQDWLPWTGEQQEDWNRETQSMIAVGDQLLFSGLDWIEYDGPDGLGEPEGESEVWQRWLSLDMEEGAALSLSMERMAEGPCGNVLVATREAVRLLTPQGEVVWERPRPGSEINDLAWDGQDSVLGLSWALMDVDGKTPVVHR